MSSSILILKNNTLIPQVLSSDLANQTNCTKCREVFEDNLLCYVSSGSTLCSVMSLALYYLRLYITTAGNFAVFVATPATFFVLTKQQLSLSLRRGLTVSLCDRLYHQISAGCLAKLNVTLLRKTSLHLVSQLTINYTI